MTSRTTAIATIFAILAAASLASAAELHGRSVTAARSTPHVMSVQLPTVVVIGKRISTDV